MALTLTYEDTLSRVKIVGDSFSSSTTVVQVERSLDQVTWTTVRCGIDAPVVSGTATIYDYEFSADVVNYYRMSSPGTVSFVSAGTAAHASNANVTPGLPLGIATGDLLLTWAAIRNSGTGTVDTPTGYTALLTSSNVKLFGKIATGAEVAPTVSFTGGVANATTSAQMAAFRGFPNELAGFASQLNASDQNIGTPALTLDEAVDTGVVLYLGWKQDDWTSVSSGAIEIGEPSSTLGDDQGITWGYLLFGTPISAFGAGGFNVTGGAAAISRGAIAVAQASRDVQTSSITPTLDAVWIKHVGSPFLNRSYECTPNVSPITRDERTAIFEIIGSSYPVAVTDLRASREISFDVITRTYQEHVDFDLILGLGEVVFIHTPAEHPIPTMYAVIKRTTERRPLLGRPCNDDWRIFTLPLREVRAPGSDVCGSTVTWQGVINSYATWQDVMDNESSWFDLLQNIGSPEDVIVP